MNNTILGLDLGTNSIGWALVEVDAENMPIKVLGMGSRIIPLNTDDKDEFSKGKSISKNRERTTMRTQRKGYDRKQLRKAELKQILLQHNIYPDDDMIHLDSIDLWKLRNDAADETQSISPQQLGRILYMLNQKRGYKSARSDSNQDAKDTKYVEEVKSRYAELKITDQTIGQYFYHELANAKTNNQYFKVKEKVYPREAYIEEFDRIMNIQKSKHNFLTDELINDIKEKVIFYQRKLKSQKSLVSICELERFPVKYYDKETKEQKTTITGPKVAPKSSPLAQLCKIWETVNNISFKIKNPPDSKYKWSDAELNLEEKKAVVNYLHTHEKLTYKEFLKIIKKEEGEVFCNSQIKKGLQGNLTFAAISKTVSDSKLLRFEPQIVQKNNPNLYVDTESGDVIEIDNLIVNEDFVHEPLYRLWHIIYSIKDTTECEAALIKNFNFTAQQAKTLANIDFNKSAYANKSAKAMRKILPYLMQGYVYSKACEMAGYNHSNSKTREQQESTTPDEKLKLLSKNSLRQPVVEKILNQMILVVNTIIDRYGKPTQIRVELTRELKQSKDERASTEKLNSDNKKINAEVVLRLESLGIPTTNKFIQKYKFIMQVRGEVDDKGKVASYSLKNAQVTNQCIYCGKSFGLKEALTGDGFDVDHIVPKDLLFDDSQTNKVLVHRSCNSQKLNRTAYDYIASKSKEELDNYLLRVDDWYKRGIISYSKMLRLKVSYDDYLERKTKGKATQADKKLWENFIDRQLRQTQYISRKSVAILSEICNKVYVTEGTVTAKLRRLWGWEDVLLHLQLPKYKNLNMTETKEWTSDHGKHKHSKEEIKDWTKRDDHRHQALDALVVACTQQGFIHRINTLSASDTKDLMNEAIKNAKKNDGELFNEDIFNENNEDAKKYKEKLTKLEQYLISKRPENFTTKYVENQLANVLISYKPGKKVATKGVRKINVDGKKIVVQDKGIIVPRGALHEQQIYGKIKVTLRNVPIATLFEHADNIVSEKIKAKVFERIKSHTNDIKAAIKSLKKEPLFADEAKLKPLVSGTMYKDEIVYRYKVEGIVEKDLPYILDNTVRAIITQRLKDYNKDPKKAFQNLEENPIWFNKAKGIKITSVRCITGLSNMTALRIDENGKAKDFVKLGNNHHFSIFADEKDNYYDQITTFWEAVERKKQGLELINKSHEDGHDFKFSIQQNQMFVYKLNPSEVDFLNPKNKSLISEHLYRVQKMSKKSSGRIDIVFRHHLETNINDSKEVAMSERYLNIQSLGKLKLFTKVHINYLGEITKVGE